MRNREDIYIKFLQPSSCTLHAHPYLRARLSETQGFSILLDSAARLCNAELTRAGAPVRFLSPFSDTIPGGLLDNPHAVWFIMGGPERKPREPCQPIHRSSPPGLAIPRPLARIPPDQLQHNGSGKLLDRIMALCL